MSLSSFIPGIQSLEMSLDSGSDVLHVCLRPVFVRLTAPADNKQCGAAADSEPQAIAARQPGRCLVLSELARLARRRCRARSCLRPGIQRGQRWPPLISHSAVSPPVRDLLFAVTNELTNEAVSVR